MPGKFVVKTRKDGQFMFNLKAGNGEIIATSEAYKQKSSCMKGIESVRKNSQTEKRFVIKERKDGQHMFNLKAGNGEVIATSEAYKQKASAKKGIASVAKNAPTAAIDDTTE